MTTQPLILIIDGFRNKVFELIKEDTEQSFLDYGNIDIIRGIEVVEAGFQSFHNARIEPSRE